MYLLLFFNYLIAQFLVSFLLDPKHSIKSPKTKSHWYHISNRRFQIPMKKITLNVMNLPSHGSDHAEHDVTEYHEFIIISFIIQTFLYVIFSLIPNFPSLVSIKDSFARYFTTANTYLFILCQYYTYSQRWKCVRYYHQDSI